MDIPVETEIQKASSNWKNIRTGAVMICSKGHIEITLDEQDECFSLNLLYLLYYYQGRSDPSFFQTLGFSSFQYFVSQKLPIHFSTILMALSLPYTVALA